MPIRISELTTPEHFLELDLADVGCRGGVHYRLRFTNKPQPRLQAVSKSGALLSAVLLSPLQVARLESLLDYYRSPKTDGSTTTRTLALTEFHAGQKGTCEVFVDGSAGLSALEDAFPEDLVSRGIHSAPVLSLTRAYGASVMAAEKRMAAVPYPVLPRKKTYLYQVGREGLPVPLEKMPGYSRVRRLPGYAALQAQFWVTGIDLSGPLQLRLTARASRLVERGRATQLRSGDQYLVAHMVGFPLGTIL